MKRSKKQPAKAKLVTVPRTTLPLADHQVTEAEVLAAAAIVGTYLRQVYADTARTRTQCLARVRVLNATEQTTLGDMWQTVQDAIVFVATARAPAEEGQG